MMSSEVTFLDCSYLRLPTPATQLMMTINSSRWITAAVALVAAGCAQDTLPILTPSALGISADKADTDRSDGNANRGPFTYAVIGDFPYGAVKRAELPALVDKINADP